MTKALALFCIISLTSSLVSTSCVPTTARMKKVGEEQGCEALERKLPMFTEQQVRHQRAIDDLKYKAVMLPISFGLGYMANYLLGLTAIIPALAPDGYSWEGNEVGAVGLKKVIRFTRLNGSRLDEVDDSAIARATFTVGMCYYEDGEWAQAAHFFESLRVGVYESHVGEDNLAYLLGECYYRMGIYDEAVANFKRFLEVAGPLDRRRPRVRKIMDLIETIQKKGLWGIE